MTTVATREETWLAKLEIQELINRYTDGINRADWQQVRDVYAPDAIWESPLLQLRCESADEFMEMVSADGQELLVQTAHATVVRLTSDRTATATTTMHESYRGVNTTDGALGPQGSENNFENYGIYYDDVAVIDGRWLFTHRLYVPVYLHMGQVNGTVMVSRADLRANA
jgi:hypothetical protein